MIEARHQRIGEIGGFVLTPVAQDQTIGLDSAGEGPHPGQYAVPIEDLLWIA